MDIIESLKLFLTNPVMLIGMLTVVEIVPIQINPWRWIFSWIGNVMNAEDRKHITEIQKELKELKRDFEENKAQEKRWHILDFVNDCRLGKQHTREEWNHVLSELGEYEKYVELKEIANGVIEEDSKYLRELFQECNRDNKFL